MDFVDIFDQLGHNYNLDGSMWRDRKWWMPIFKSIFKASCDQAYVVYKRVCEIDEEERETLAAAAALRGARDGSPSAGTRCAG